MKWEYRREMHTAGDKPLEEWLNSLGQEGWQLCAIVEAHVSYVYFFKRELPNA